MPKLRRSPRKSPRQSRAHHTVGVILEAAARILEARGLDGYTTNAVADRAGVSIGSLYQYFPNKDALTVALIAREQEARAGGLESTVATLVGTTLQQGIAALIRAALAGQREAPRLAASLDYEEARLPVRAALIAAEARLDAILATFLAEHFPGLGDAACATAARSCRAIARALIDEYVNSPKPDFAAAERESISAVLGYLNRLS